MKYLSILGSTGSIGTNALDIVRMHPHLFGIKALACANNISLLARQIREFKPELVCVIDENKALELSRILKGEFKPQIVYGEHGFIETALYNKSNIVLLAMVGAAGLKPGDNIFIIESEWYSDNPLVIQGPGAGREVTAAGVLTDLIEVLHSS